MGLLVISPDIRLEDESVRSERDLCATRALSDERATGTPKTETHEEIEEIHVLKAGSPEVVHDYRSGTVTIFPPADQHSNLAESPSTPNTTQNTPLHQLHATRASVWLRSVARTFDLFWQTFLVVALLQGITDLSSWGVVQYIVFVSFVGLPVALIIDSLILGVLGSTPGRCLIGIRIISPCHRTLGLKRAFRRNFGLLKSGIVFDLCPFLPAALYRQYSRLRSHQRTTYDRQFSIEVVWDSRFAVRVWFGLFLAVTLSWLPIPAGLSGNQFSANSETPLSLTQLTLASTAFSDSWSKRGHLIDAESQQFGHHSDVSLEGEITLAAQTLQTVSNDRASRDWVNPFSGFSASLPSRWTTEFDHSKDLITWLDSDKDITVRYWRLPPTDKPIQHAIDSEIARQVSAAVDPGAIEFSITERDQDGVTIFSLVQIDSMQTGNARLSEWASFSDRLFKLTVSGSRIAPDFYQAQIQARAVFWETLLNQ